VDVEIVARRDDEAEGVIEAPIESVNTGDVESRGNVERVEEGEGDEDKVKRTDRVKKYIVGVWAKVNVGVEGTVAVERAVSEEDWLLTYEGEVVPLPSPSKLIDGRSEKVPPVNDGSGVCEALPVEEGERVPNPRDDVEVNEGGWGVKDE
jgi:hypothetical protein